MTAAQAINEYGEYSVTWDGALDQIVCVDEAGEIFETPYGALVEQGTLLQVWIDEIETAAYSDNVRVEIHRLWHPHSPDVDACECAQFATGHSPEYTFGDDSEDDE